MCSYDGPGRLCVMSGEGSANLQVHAHVCSRRSDRPFWPLSACLFADDVSAAYCRLVLWRNEELDRRYGRPLRCASYDARLGAGHGGKPFLSALRRMWEVKVITCETSDPGSMKSRNAGAFDFCRLDDGGRLIASDVGCGRPRSWHPSSSSYMTGWAIAKLPEWPNENRLLCEIYVVNTLGT